MKPDYGTATHEEINEGFKVANSIAETIKALPNPAVRNMVKNLVGMIYIEAPADAKEGEK